MQRLPQKPRGYPDLLCRCYAVPVHRGADALALPSPGYGAGSDVRAEPTGGGDNIGHQGGHLFLTDMICILKENSLRLLVFLQVK